MQRQRRWWGYSVDVGETQLFELLANQAQYFFYLLRGAWKTEIPQEIQKSSSTGMLRMSSPPPHEGTELPEAFCATSTI